MKIVDSYERNKLQSQLQNIKQMKSKKSSLPENLARFKEFKSKDTNFTLKVPIPRGFFISHKAQAHDTEKVAYQKYKQSLRDSMKFTKTIDDEKKTFTSNLILLISFKLDWKCLAMLSV